MAICAAGRLCLWMWAWWAGITAWIKSAALPTLDGSLVGQFAFDVPLDLALRTSSGYENYITNNRVVDK